MSYEALQARILSLPEKYLDEVAEYIDFLLFRYERFGDKDSEERKERNDLSAFFGSMVLRSDPISIQEGMRNEWE